MFQVLLVVCVLPFFLHALKNSALEQRDHVLMLIWLGLTCFVFCALALSRNLPDGVNLQYSGAAFLAITVGYARALLSMGLLMMIVRPVEQWGVSFWVDALLPVWLMVWLVVLSRRYLPANPFVFLLGCGFIGIFMVCAVQETLSAVVVAIVQGVPVSAALFSGQTASGLLLAGGEATLEGMIITLLVVYFPRAVRLFDDQFYLSRPM